MNESLMFILFALIAAHFLCDFALQNDFIATFKNKYIDKMYNPIWFWVLLAHSMIHALAVLLITKSVSLAILMLVAHFEIDNAKCSNKITFNQDQSLHLFVVLLIFLIYVFFFN